MTRVWTVITLTAGLYPVTQAVNICTAPIGGWWTSGCSPAPHSSLPQLVPSKSMTCMWEQIFTLPIGLLSYKVQSLFAFWGIKLKAVRSAPQYACQSLQWLSASHYMHAVADPEIVGWGWLSGVSHTTWQLGHSEGDQEGMCPLPEKSAITKDIFVWQVLCQLNPMNTKCAQAKFPWKLTNFFAALIVPADD